MRVYFYSASTESALISDTFENNQQQKKQVWLKMLKIAKIIEKCKKKN